MQYDLFFSATFTKGAADAVEDALTSTATQRRVARFDDRVTMAWVLPPDRFHEAPRLRSLLVRSSASEWSEEARILDDFDPQDADLVQIMPPNLEGANELERRIDPGIRCEVCHRPHSTFPEHPTLRATFPPPLLVTGLFTPDKSFLRIASTELLDKLEANGLTRGLERFPITIENEHDQPHYGLYANQLLELATPYGCVVPGDPCPGCGAAAAKHAFYNTYHRPAVEADWYHTSHGTKAWLVVTGRVYRWLRNEGAPWVGTLMSGKTLYGYRFGWYPDERERAFLPERFHGVSDAPVEPIRKDELTRFQPRRPARR